jgi:hypothetical protein
MGWLLNPIPWKTVPQVGIIQIGGVSCKSERRKMGKEQNSKNRRTKEPNRKWRFPFLDFEREVLQARFA